MSLIDKIPPMISAVAFGYGVGMAAPESAIESMQGAVAPSPRDAAYAYAARRAPNAPMFSQPVALRGEYAVPSPGGVESLELQQLRQAGAAYGGRQASSCQHHPSPTHSRHPVQSPYGDYGGADIDLDALDADSEQALSRLQLPDVGVSVSKQTLKYVRYFTRSDRGRGMFTSWLKRSGKYQELISDELRRRQLPEDLIWVAMIESGFDAKARSPAGAVGLWQFMPATGAVYGLRRNQHVDQRKNPRLATQAAAHHLRDLYMRFGNWDLALAAYNMGYEQLLDRIDRYGTSDFNELARQGALPTETAKYVPKISAAAIVANNLERFNFDDVKTAIPLDLAEIAVPPRMPLKILAKAAGVSTSTIRKLNPDVLGDKVPPGKGDLLLMLPSDKLARARAALPALFQRQGYDHPDVLDPIDLLGGPDPHMQRDVADADASLLSLLPRYKKKRRGRSMRDPLPDGDSLAIADQPRRAGRETLMYRVGSGDTLIGVARTFGLDVEDVAQQNGLSAKSKLREGALLKLKVRPDIVNQTRKLDAFRLREDAKPAKRKSERSAG